jgi:hypothetical protein
MQAIVNSPLALRHPARLLGHGTRTVQAALVDHNCDCVGLLAVAIYEQHRHDWLRNYREKFGQNPDEHAWCSYELAEHTPRRLAAYRQLAEARLDERVTPAPVGATESFLTKFYRGDNNKRRRASRLWRRLAGIK